MTHSDHDSGRPHLRKLWRQGPPKHGKTTWVVLPNSLRSTMPEIERLRDEELARTGIEWEVCDA